MQHQLPHLSPPGGCCAAPRLAAVAAVAALAVAAAPAAVAALVVMFALTLGAPPKP